MSKTQLYLQKCREITDRVAEQEPAIAAVAERFARCILSGRMVHVFGSGHSRMMVEEMWPRYGSFPGFNPLVELSLSFHNLVVGCNGQRQAMFLENVSGLAAQVLRNFDLDARDCGLVISSSGCNIAPIEMAEGMQQRGMYVAAIVSSQHSEVSTSKDPRGKKLQAFSNAVLDTGAPVGDAMIPIDGLDTPVAPGSTVGGCLLINTIKAEVAQRLTDAGQPPKVLTAGAVIGSERAAALFQAAYDEHAHRISAYYAEVGKERPDA